MRATIFILILSGWLSISFATTAIRPLSEEETAQVMELIRQRKSVDRDTLHRALISHQTTLRADAARLLGDVGDKTSIPHLIAALNDMSMHEGALYKIAGPETTRYWANESLKKLTKRDFGYVWNASEADRQAAIKRWRDWEKSRK